jgi:hypothetical protein
MMQVDIGIDADLYIVLENSLLPLECHRTDVSNLASDV